MLAPHDPANIWAKCLQYSQEKDTIKSSKIWSEDTEESKMSLQRELENCS